MLKPENRPPLSEPLKDIINGYLMGDGFLNKSGALQVEQGKNQYKFVGWMLDQLKEYCTAVVMIKGVKERDNDQIRSYRFTTRAWFKDFHKIWYKPKGAGFEKRLPANISSMFSPLFITVWFACDGTKILGSRGAKFEVTAFTVEERQVLKDLFLQKYQIKSVINSQGCTTKGTPQFALCINAEEYDKFYALITQYDLIITLFPYKLHKKTIN